MEFVSGLQTLQLLPVFLVCGLTNFDFRFLVCLLKVRSMTSVVECKACKALHKSPIQSVATKQEFIKAKDKSELFENMCKCPKCGRMSMYSSFDYIWYEEKVTVQ